MLGARSRLVLICTWLRSLARPLARSLGPARRRTRRRRWWWRRRRRRLHTSFVRRVLPRVALRRTLHYKPTAVLTGKRAREPSAGARARVRARGEEADGKGRSCSPACVYDHGTFRYIYARAMRRGYIRDAVQSTKVKTRRFILDRDMRYVRRRAWITRDPSRKRIMSECKRYFYFNNYIIYELFVLENKQR